MKGNYATAYLSIVSDCNKFKIWIVDADKILLCIVCWFCFHWLRKNIHLILLTDAFISTVVSKHQASDTNDKLILHKFVLNINSIKKLYSIYEFIDQISLLICTHCPILDNKLQRMLHLALFQIRINYYNYNYHNYHCPC